MDKQMMVFSYNGMLLNSKKTLKIIMLTERTQARKECLLHGFVYMKL